MFTAGRILRNLNRGDPNAGPVSSVLVPQPKKKMKDRRKFRCYVPFVWQALMATCIGFLVILIGITLCVVGYYADHIQSLTAPRRLDNVTSALSPTREKKPGTEGRAEGAAGAGRRGESPPPGSAGYNYLRCMIYIGPALMSCGSFAIVFSCVVVCETRDKLLEFMDERERSNLPRKTSLLKFDFFRSIGRPTTTTSTDHRRPNNTAAASDVFSSDAGPSVSAGERPRPVRPASLSVAELDAGQRQRLLREGTDDHFMGSCGTGNDRFGTCSLGYNDERMGTTGEGPESRSFSAGQGSVLDRAPTNRRSLGLEHISNTSCRTDTGRFDTDTGYVADNSNAGHEGFALGGFSTSQNHRPTGWLKMEERTVEGRAAGVPLEGFLSVITAPIDRSLRSLPRLTGHNGSHALRSRREGDRRSLDGCLTASWTTDANTGRRRRSDCRCEAVGHACGQQGIQNEAADQPQNSRVLRQMELRKADDDERRTIAQGCWKGGYEREGPGPFGGPTEGPGPAMDTHHHRCQMLEGLTGNAVDSTKASGVSCRRSPPCVASSWITSGSLQSISGAIVQFRPTQTLPGQRSVHIIHKAHVHEEPIPGPTFSTLPLRFNQQDQQQRL